MLNLPATGVLHFGIVDFLYFDLAVLAFDKRDVLLGLLVVLPFGHVDARRQVQLAEVQVARRGHVQLVGHRHAFAVVQQGDGQVVGHDKGEMVPIGSMLNITTTYGPDPVIRYNGYPAADLIGDADPRVLSSTQAMTELTAMSKNLLPNGMNIEWTDLSYQQSTQGNAALIVFPMSVLLAFLVLAALYESWTLPLAVILIVPMTMLSALFGVWLTGGDNNVFVQVGLVVLMGLACKNAILIVEFARELEMQGKGIVESALEACRLRLRPIVMTSIAFIAGTIPLILGHGAGAEVRGVTGITVFSGMLGVTLFGLFLTPVFYVALRKLVTRKQPALENQTV